MFMSNLSLTIQVIFFVAFICIAVGAALLVAVHLNNNRRQRRFLATNLEARSSRKISSKESADAECMPRYFPTKEPNRDSLGWSAAADIDVSADSINQPAEEAGELSGKGKTILIADDDPVITYALAQRLQQLGFQVIRSPDAAHALMGAMKVEPDLIILDVNMPSGNGLAVCEMMASDPRYAGIPVVIHSVLSDEATKERCRQLGARYVEKSSKSWEEIKTLVETSIGKGGGKDNPMELMPQSDGALPLIQPHTPPAVNATSDHTGTEYPESALPTKPSDNIPQRLSPTCGHGRILCIDGPQGELELLQNRLASLGVEVSRLSDLDEGFLACLTEKPQLVIIQTVSSGKNLKEILHRFAEHPLTSKYPIIFINQDNVISAEELPISDNFRVLQCPIVWKNLIRELEKVIPISGSKSEDPLAIIPPPGKDSSHPGDQATVADENPLQADLQVNTHLKILCIDDDPIIVKSIAVRLNRYGIEVKGASNGTAGYLQAVSEKPDLILLDLQMPSGDGHYTLAKLREHSRTKDIPIVMLTAETHPGVRRQMIGLGAAGFLSKPVRWGELFQELGRYIQLPKQLILDYKLHEDQLISV
jgi:CheY-like chemotaxis protein